MTLATSSSIHHAQRYSHDRIEDIMRDAERTRLGVSQSAAPPDVLPEGVDDLTPTRVQGAAGQIEERPRSLLDGIIGRLMSTRPARA
jgi:hypothetical protein